MIEESGFTLSRAKLQLVSTLLSHYTRETLHDWFWAITIKVNFNTTLMLYARRTSQYCFCAITRKFKFKVVFTLSCKKDHTAQVPKAATP